MKKLLAITLLLSACGGDIKSKDKNIDINNGIVVNNGQSVNNGGTNNGTTNNGTSNNGVTNNTTQTTINTTPPEDCGNGDLDTTEACEGFELRDKTCRSEGFVGGTLKCTNTCVLDDSECEKCGNGVIDGNEQCDGNDFAAATCGSVIQDSLGELQCDNQCKFVTEDCKPALKNCTELADCLRVCNGAQPCSDECVARTPQASLDLYAAASQCSQHNQCQDQACLDEFCKPQIEACFNE